MLRISVRLCFVLLLALLAPASVAAQQVTASSVTVSGRVTNGTAGAAVPQGLEVSLFAGTGDSQKLLARGPVAAGGSFTFSNVAVAPGQALQAAASLGRMTYASQPVEPAAGQAQVDLPLTIYEPTTDSGKLRILRTSTLLQFLNADQVEAMVLYTIANEGDRTVQDAVQAPDGRPASLRFSLPTGATRVQFQGGAEDGRFVTTPDGFLDALPVPPGQQAAQILVSFVLPYNGAAHVEQKIYYPAESAAVNLVESGVKLAGAQLKDDGVHDNTNGIRTHAYSNGAALAAGQALVYDLSGKPDISASKMMGMDAPAPDDRGRILAGGWALGMALVLAGILWMRLFRRSSTSRSDRAPRPAL
jgi:hypothetical protein